MAKNQLSPEAQARLDQMDVDAEKARKAFNEMVGSDAVDLETVKIVAAWVGAFWITAGYKRLVKIVLDWASNQH